MPAMSYFLAKSDPKDYGLADLERDGRTVWDGVRNPQAVKAIREMSPGDRIFLYHSGGEPAVVGLGRVAAAPQPDPKDPRAWVFEIEFVRRLEPAVSLREIKDSGLFTDWALVRQPRLSTMRAPEEFVSWMRQRRPSAGL